MVSHPAVLHGTNRTLRPCIYSPGFHNVGSLNPEIQSGMKSLDSIWNRYKALMSMRVPPLAAGAHVCLSLHSLLKEPCSSCSTDESTTVDCGWENPK